MWTEQKVPNGFTEVTELYTKTEYLFNYYKLILLRKVKQFYGEIMKIF